MTQRPTNHNNTNRKNVKPSAGASLDYRGQNCTHSTRREWTRKQKRAYHRILSGLTKWMAQGYRVRFITLTTSTEASIEDLNKHFRALVMRIRRKYGQFVYFKVKTDEGNGVLHILAVCPYIDQRWLSEAWSELHKSPVVDIRLLKGGAKGIARYLVSQYCAGQEFIRQSWAYEWVYKGFIKVWEGLKWMSAQVRGTREALLNIWRAHLTGKIGVKGLVGLGWLHPKFVPRA